MMNLLELPSKESATTLLYSSASLTTGLLCFGGMLALWPSIPVACAAFVLTVAYEGEIYKQNIQEGLNKLSGDDETVRLWFAKKHLLESFPKSLLNNERFIIRQPHPFYTKYKEMTTRLHNLEHQGYHPEKLTTLQQNYRLDLDRMEQWYAEKLFSTNNADYDDIQQQFFYYQTTRYAIALFSLLTSLCMSIATLYLLIGAFTTLSWLAMIPVVFWPILMVPMALSSGIASGLMTYNAFTDLVQNNTLVQFFQKLYDDLQNDPYNSNNILMMLASVFMVSLTVFIGICAEGTWWTVFSETPMVFSWLMSIPDALLYVMTPIVIGCSTLIFNIENTLATLMLMDAWCKASPSVLHDLWLAINQLFHSFIDWMATDWTLSTKLFETNPFELLLTSVVPLLSKSLLLCHTLSAGANFDRLPGFSAISTAFFGVLSDLCNDASYFVQSKQHTHSPKELLRQRLTQHALHDHGDSLPDQWIQQYIEAPLTYLKEQWDQWTQAPTPIAEEKEEELPDRNATDEDILDLNDTPPIPVENHRPWRAGQRWPALFQPAPRAANEPFNELSARSQQFT